MISIIVPMYNCETYIDRCIGSLVNQTFVDIEIILINDGSTDMTAVKCDGYADKDRRIRVIHQKNKGVSAARNKGLEVACGEYVLFVDGDDYVEPEYVEKLYTEVATVDADIVMCNYYYRDVNGEVISRSNYTYVPQMKVFDNIKALYMFEDQQYGTFFDVVWNKIFRRTLFEGIRFPEGVSLVEDISVLPELLYKAERISIIGDKLYNYIYRETSLSNGTFNRQEDFLLRRVMMEQRLEKYIKWGIKELVLMHSIHLYSLIAKNKDGIDGRLKEIQREYREYYFRGKYRRKLSLGRRVKFLLAAISLKLYHTISDRV